MEIIPVLLLAIAPFIIKGITSAVKKIQSIRYSSSKTMILRFFVAVLSLVTAIGISIVNGTELDGSVIPTFVDAFLVFLSATAVYFLQDKKD